MQGPQMRRSRYPVSNDVRRRDARMIAAEFEFLDPSGLIISQASRAAIAEHALEFAYLGGRVHHVHEIRHRLQVAVVANALDVIARERGTTSTAVIAALCPGDFGPEHLAEVTRQARLAARVATASGQRHASRLASGLTSVRDLANQTGVSVADLQKELRRLLADWRRS